MAKAKRGAPCWYELTTPDPAGAARFYGNLLGWSVEDAGMPGFDYRIAKSGEDMVAGMLAPQGPNAEPLWMIYVTVTDCDKAVKAVAKAGGAVHQEPTDIPETGRFAIVADPQGATLGILQPEGSDSKAFNQKQAGHGQWNELMTSDPEAALAFYGTQFGWKPGDAIDMGPGGTYQIFRHGKGDIGGMMKQAAGMPGPKHPFWLPYFGTDSIGAAIGRTTEAGGTVIHGPMEIPGGAFIMIGNDPQGALFALVGGK